MERGQKPDRPHTNADKTSEDSLAPRSAQNSTLQKMHEVVGNAAVAQLLTQSGAADALPPNGLPESLKGGLENLSGMSMDAVRVHYNSPEPAKLDAAAFARGDEIHLAPGQHEHLPHEGWHVVQQRQGRVRQTTRFGQVPVNDDPVLEREADVMGARAVQRKGPTEVVQRRTAGVDVAQLEVRSLEQFEKDSKKKTGFVRSMLGTDVAPRSRVKKVDDALKRFHDHRQITSAALDQVVRPITEELSTKAQLDVDLLVDLHVAVKKYRIDAGSEARQGLDTLQQEVEAEISRYSSLLGSDPKEVLGQAKKQLQTSVAGDIHFVWKRIANLIDFAAPTKGSDAKLTLGVRIPIGETPAYVGGEMTLEISRDPEGKLKVRCDLALLGGGEFGIAKIEGKVGGYLEAEGGDSKVVTTLLNYGLYTRFRESPIVPELVTNKLWGKRTSDSGKEAAETWARGTESALWGASGRVSERRQANHRAQGQDASVEEAS